MEQKIRQNNKNQRNYIGLNIRKIRLDQRIKQTEMVRKMNLKGEKIIREEYVKIERGISNIKIEHLRAIRDILGTSYEELLDF